MQGPRPKSDEHVLQKKKTDAQLATFRPLNVSPAEDPTGSSHEQIDFILAKSQNAKAVRNAYSDTKSALPTDHYPVIAQLKVIFREKKEDEKPKPKMYCAMDINTSPADMNTFLTQKRVAGCLRTYEDWVKSYGDYVASQEPKTQKAWREYISAETRTQIQLRCELEKAGKMDEARVLKKQIKKMMKHV
jgi:hypothetical protein